MPEIMNVQTVPSLGFLLPRSDRTVMEQMIALTINKAAATTTKAMTIFRRLISLFPAQLSWPALGHTFFYLACRESPKICLSRDKHEGRTSPAPRCLLRIGKIINNVGSKGAVLFELQLLAAACAHPVGVSCWSPHCLFRPPFVGKPVCNHHARTL